MDINELLREHFPTGHGPATTARREQLRSKLMSSSPYRRGPAGSHRSTLSAMDQGLRYIQELERTLPAGAKPLVMRAFAAATDVSNGFGKVAGNERIDSGEVFRLVLLAMRQYLELYAALAGPASFSDGTPKPVVVTLTEFRNALPLLARWGIHVPNAEARFEALDRGGVGVLRFDEFCRWCCN